MEIFRILKGYLYDLVIDRNYYSYIFFFIYKKNNNYDENSLTVSLIDSFSKVCLWDDIFKTKNY